MKPIKLNYELVEKLRNDENYDQGYEIFSIDEVLTALAVMYAGRDEPVEDIPDFIDFKNQLDKSFQNDKFRMVKQILGKASYAKDEYFLKGIKSLKEKNIIE